MQNGRIITWNTDLFTCGFGVWIIQKRKSAQNYMTKELLCEKYFVQEAAISETSWTSISRRKLSGGGGIVMRPFIYHGRRGPFQSTLKTSRCSLETCFFPPWKIAKNCGKSEILICHGWAVSVLYNFYRICINIIQPSVLLRLNSSLLPWKVWSRGQTNQTFNSLHKKSSINGEVAILAASGRFHGSLWWSFLMSLCKITRIFWLLPCTAVAEPDFPPPKQ